jgi:hypothetical protein
MILYVNGDSHTAAAEAVNPHAFAEDDSRYPHLGRLPHPDNLQVSWGRVLSDVIKSGFKCDAESAASNSRILRTSRDWLAQAPLNNTQVMVIIQWSTWEREEWLIDGVYYQVNGSGIDQVPDGWQDRYKQWIVDIDWQQVTQRAHDEIWRFHLELEEKNIPHVFFNGNNHFGKIDVGQRHDWGHSYIDPYSPDSTYDAWLKGQGHDTVSPNSWHFGREAHTAWARFMLQYIIKNQLI